MRENKIVQKYIFLLSDARRIKLRNAFFFRMPENLKPREIGDTGIQLNPCNSKTSLCLYQIDIVQNFCFHSIF